MIQFKAILLLLAVALTLPGEAANASHPFHVTRAEVEYNADRQTFEVAICVWPEDLALAVSKMEKRTVKIDSETEASRDEIFSRYVAKKFRFVAQTKTDNTKKTDAKSDDAKQEKPAAAKIRWVGSSLKSSKVGCTSKWMPKQLPQTGQSKIECSLSSTMTS